MTTDGSVARNPWIRSLVVGAGAAWLAICGFMVAFFAMLSIGWLEPYEQPAGPFPPPPPATPQWIPWSVVVTTLLAGGWLGVRLARTFLERAERVSRQ